MTEQSELLEAYSAACRNAEGVRGEVCLHASDWMKLGDAIRALAAQPSDDVRERKPVAWRYEYSVQYRNRMECTKNLAPLSILSEHRWSPEEARNYSETPLYTALATTTQPDTDSGLAGELAAMRIQGQREGKAAVCAWLRHFTAIKPTSEGAEKVAALADMFEQSERACSALAEGAGK